MKKCTRCRKTYNDIETSFFRDSKTEDGFTTRCKRCKKYGECPISRARRDARRYEKDKWKCDAREYARRKFSGMKFNCAAISCLEHAKHLHHVDYSEPLAVVPLCEKHHRGIHN